MLAVKLAVFIKWPDRDELQKTMPMDFRKNFRKYTIIIDCFEIFIERPTSLLARAQTWSNYKKHNTVKYLIGITPQGSVAFISEGSGGRVSDVHLTEHCGILDNLLPGDVMLADQGFTIEQSVGMFCAEVKHPKHVEPCQLALLRSKDCRQVLASFCFYCGVLKSILLTGKNSTVQKEGGSQLHGNDVQERFCLA